MQDLSSLDTIDNRLEEIAQQLRAHAEVQPVPLRDILGWVCAKRRGFFVVRRIHEALDKAGLVTDPDFESAYIESAIRFLLTQDAVSERPDEARVEAQVGPFKTTGVANDPTYRISKLAAANKTLTSVAPDKTVQEAATIMLVNDFSQLPVMTNERDVKGVISWVSIGTRLVLGNL